MTPALAALAATVPAGTALVPGGLVRTSGAPAPVCGCGTLVGRTGAVLIIQRVRGRGGDRTSRTSRVPLCAAHLAAHDRQVAARGLAIARAWAL